MLTKITDELWLDFDKLVRVSKEDGEIKYTIDFKERLVTYYAPREATEPFLRALDIHEARRLQPVQTLEELLAAENDNPTGEEV